MSHMNCDASETFEDLYIPAPIGCGPRAPQEAVCWAFMGAAGGAGVTSIAIQTAHELTTQLKEASQSPNEGRARVCLFDLDFENTTTAQYLDIDTVFHPKELDVPADRIDAEFLASLTVRHDTGFDVICSTPTLNGNAHVNPETIVALLDIASRLYDYVILDVPRLWQLWTHAAIGAADRFSFVTELTVPALCTVQDRCKALPDLVGHDVKPGVLINKYDRRSFRNSLRLADVQKTLGQDPDGVVIIDTDSVREAINRGEPVGLSHAEGRFAKHVRAIVSEWRSQADARIPDLQVVA